MNQTSTYQKSSIGKKQIVAVTGLILILFVCGHLLGNLFIFVGPEAFNHYAAKLAGLRPGLYVVEAGLTIMFVVHLMLTLSIAHENAAARPVKYQVSNPGASKTHSSCLMPLSGSVLLIFVLWHLWDFTFSNHDGLRSVLSDGVNYGLYGVVVNSFKDPLHSILYILSMAAVGLHLSHGLQSVVQTFGLSDGKFLPVMKKISFVFGFSVAAIFSAIPMYVLFVLK